MDVPMYVAVQPHHRTIGTIANTLQGGGMATSQNRTKWPLKGGAVSIQPGWFPGHSNAQFYINMGYGNEPLNYSHNAVPVFQITGPSNQQYDGTFCLPQVPLPANYTPQVGDNATIQIIEVAQHGASLYNVRSLPHHQATSRSNQLTCNDSAQTSPSQSPRTCPKSTAQTASTARNRAKKSASRSSTRPPARLRRTTPL